MYSTLRFHDTVQVTTMSAMGQVCTHVGGGGHKRRAWGRGGGGGGEVKGEGRETLLGTYAPDCSHQWQSEKELVKV